MNIQSLKRRADKLDSAGNDDAPRMATFPDGTTVCLSQDDWKAVFKAVDGKTRTAKQG